MPDITEGQTVTFDDGKGNTLEGQVLRTWTGRGGTHVTIRTSEDKPRTFIRYASSVTSVITVTLGNGQDVTVSAACAANGHCPPMGSCDCDGIGQQIVADGWAYDELTGA